MIKNKHTILYHIIWLFIIGSFFGFVIETIWYLIKHGIFINKQGLWYGPFKPIYGVGLILLTMILYRLKDKNVIYLFIIGTLIGSIFEYLAAIFQEIMFGTYTWTYSSFNLNINGKIYLPYCLIWGILSIIWIKFGVKYYLKIFDKLCNRRFKIISILMLIFIIYDISLTSLITYRYAKRGKNIEPANKIEQLIDEKYPNELVHEKFPKLRIIK